MPEFAGTLQRPFIVQTLWLMVAWPLMGFAWQVFWVRPRLARSKEADALRELASARVAGIGGIAMAAAITLRHALLLVGLPARGQVLFQSLAPSARFGDVDIGIDLLLDARALFACGLASIVVLAAALILAKRPATDRGWRPWAWLQLALAGAQASLLADSFVGLAMGWTLVVVASVWLVGWHDVNAGMAAAMRGVAAISAMLLGAALLFWGLGGPWEDDGYAPEPHSRLVAEHVGMGVGDATVSMTSFSGSPVFLDDARTPFARAPFAPASLPPGTHFFRVHPTDGTGDVRTLPFQVAPGDEMVLLPVGPTLSFHTLEDELSLVDRVRAPSQAVSLQEHLGPGGVAVVAGALLAFLGAAAAMSAWAPPLASPRLLSGVAAGAATSFIGPFLLIRLAALLPLAQNAGLVAASVGAGLLLGSVWSALAHTGLRRWLIFVGGAPCGLTCVALGLGGPVPAMEIMIATGVAAAVVLLVAARAGEDEEAMDWATFEPAPEPRSVRSLEHLGALLVSMDRWVVGATASAIGGLSRVAAWAVAKADDELVTSPGNRAAFELERGVECLRPWIGVPLSTVAWGMLAAAALAVLFHAVWPVG